MRPSQLLDMQADLLSRLEDSRFRRVAETQLMLDQGFQESHGIRDDVLKKNARQITAAMTAYVKAAHLYRVTEDMTYLVQHVAAQLDETDTFHRELAPAGVGLVRFDRPMPIHDVRGRIMLGHWLLWGPIGSNQGPSSLMIWWNDPLSEPDEAAVAWLQAQADTGMTDEDMEEVYRVLGRWHWVGSDLYWNGRSLGPPFNEASEETKARIIEEGDTPTPAQNTIRYVHALWFLLGQTVTTTEDETIDRAARRRAIRKGLPPRVTTITLRRRSEARGEGESVVEWHHRWIVSGHPRWQPYGKQRADHEHVLGPMTVAIDGKPERWCIHPGCDHHVARIYIAPFTKGPPDAPLKQSAKVHDLRR